MTLMNALPDDTAGQKKTRRRWLSLGCVAAMILLAVYLAWNLPAEHRINQFFAAVEAQNFEKAFGIWNNDPDWRQHPERYATAGYPYGRFLSDWGTDSEYGTIRNHKIVHATSQYGNTTLVVVDINGRPASLMTLAVANRARTLTFPPFALSPTYNGFGGKTWQLSYH